jgi:MFS family permease
MFSEESRRLFSVLNIKKLLHQLQQQPRLLPTAGSVKASKEEDSLRPPPNALLRQVAVMMAMSFGNFMNGTVTAYAGPALPSLLYNSNSAARLQLAELDVSWIISGHTLGAVLGCCLAIPGLALLGRRGAALYPMSLAYLLGYIILATAVSKEMIIIGRVMCGIGMGQTFSVTSVYLMEAVSPAYRGILGVLPPLLTQVGLLVTYVGGMWLDWSRLAVALLGLLVPSVLLFWAIPESPCYLAANGRQAAMEAALERLGRGDEKTDPKFQQLLSE